jgi:hypothetical protein
MGVRIRQNRTISPKSRSTSRGCHANYQRANLIERGTNCEELREEGLFANSKVSLSNGTWYTVRIEAKGAEVRVYLDGKLIAQDKDIDGTVRKSNTIGFAACCEDLLPYVFYFDDIKVWLISQ